MIKGKQIQPRLIERPIVNYRKIDALSQSMLKCFNDDPVKFYEEYKLGKRRRQKNTTASILGDLVDFFILECKGNEEEFNNRFDEKFVLYEEVKGSGQVFTLAEYIFDEAQGYLDDKGVLTCPFDTIFTNALIKIQREDKYKGKDKEKVLEDFYTNGKQYYDKLISNIGKVVVDVSLIDKMRTVANNILKDNFTKNIFSWNPTLEYHTHFPIEWGYELYPGKTYPCKSEIDMLFIDHSNYTIQPMDLKTNYDNESFERSYLKNGLYLQNSFYMKAVRKWATENGMKEYTVKPMKFVVGDTSSNNRRPIVYETSYEDEEMGMKGFNVKGTYYKGVDELVKDIVWAEEQGIWNCSREVFGNKGIITLSIDYESQDNNNQYEKDFDIN